jgi:hypothetical protein
MELSADFKRALRLVVYYYFNGTLAYLAKDGQLLSEVDYDVQLTDKHSTKVQIFIIYTNNIKMNESGNILNQKHAMNRASPFIITVCNEREEAYKVIPEFEPWEMELY